MVQRKVPNKLGIRPDHAKSDKRLGNLMKPSSCQHLHLQDGKNRGADLKKKMKKSRSFKLSNIEGLTSSSSSSSTSREKTIVQPGKPPTFKPSASDITPQKQPLLKLADGSPNYMKSTSCSEARKESCQVSFRSPQTCSDSKIIRRRNSINSKLGSVSGNKPAKAQTRTSSLKLVRTLTKTPSFKPARASTKKCSRVALCADVDVQRATCSSTLKDSKFPAYLMLNPGGTESEGTSAMKVCPYTYCSLNGHHHTPSPPLKSFLKARRRSLKSQKTMKLEALSPRKLRSFTNGIEEIGSERMILGGPFFKELDSDASTLSPMIQMEGMDFFIEIYTTKRGDNAEANEQMTKDGTDMAIGFADEIAEHELPCVGGDEPKPELDDDAQISESLSDGSPRSEIDFEEKLEHCCGIISTDVETCHEEPIRNDAEEDLLSILGGSLPWNFNQGCNEEESHASIRVGDDPFADVDMEWEEGALYTSEIDALSSAEIVADEVVEFSEEDDICIEGSSQASDTLHYDQGSSVDDLMDVFSTLEDKETDNDSNGNLMIPDLQYFLEEPALSMEKIQDNDVPQMENELSDLGAHHGDAKKDYVNDATNEATQATDEVQDHSMGKTEREQGTEQSAATDDPIPELELTNDEARVEMVEEIADTKTSNEVQIPVLSLDSIETDQDDQVDNNQTLASCHVSETVDSICSGQDTADVSLSAERRDLLFDGEGECDCTNNVENSVNWEKDQEKARQCRLPSLDDPDREKNLRADETQSAGTTEGTGEETMEKNARSDAAGVFIAADKKISKESGSMLPVAGSDASQEAPGTYSNRIWTRRSKRQNEDDEQLRKFNPREPNYLPHVPEPDPEKVDLRHQLIDERKNSEEWMVDYALRQAVNKLAPARKRKVALLVEAFETVIPVPKCEAHLRDTTAAFAHGRPIQACS